MPKTYNSTLAKNIIMEYTKLINESKKFSYKMLNKKIIEGTGGKVNVYNLMAYQIGWCRLLLRWYKSGVQSKTIVMPGDGFDTWDYVGLARHFYKKYNYSSLDKYINKLKKLVNRIVHFVEDEYQLKNLNRVGVWDWCTLSSGKKWPLSKWVQINTVAPFKKASAKLRQILKS